MLYSEKMPIFTAKRPAQTVTVDGAAYRYVRIGAGRDKTLALLNGGMNAATLKTLKKKCFFAPLALWYMTHCNYEKLKPRLIQSGMSHLRNESAEEAAYARDMFETIFKDFQQAKDMHITGLLEDLMNQTPVTEADFRALKGRILLIFPNQDFFSDQMQQDLIKLMQDPQIVYVSGGHLGTVLKAGDYVREIKKFLEGME